MKTVLIIIALLGVFLAFFSIYGIYELDWSFALGWLIAIPSVIVTGVCAQLIEIELRKGN